MRAAKPLNVMVDLFMYREPEEAEKQAAEEKERLLTTQEGPQDGDSGQPDTFDNQADLQTQDPNAKPIEWSSMDNQLQGGQNLNQSQGASWDPNF